MNRIINFIKKELVLFISVLAALITIFIIPPDKKYLDYFNLHVLVLLFCLMAVVQGLVSAGFFDKLSIKALELCKSTKLLSIILVNLVFFSAMFITNDVALIVFVPFTIGVLSGVRQRDIIFVVVMETIAANLGSTATPFGNPHNLYLYSYYNMSLWDFFKIVFPISALGYVIIMVLMCFSKIVNGEREVKALLQKLDIKKILLYIGLFVVCVLCVLNIIPTLSCFLIVTLFVLLIDWKILKKVDYCLLATFAGFFVFVGNITRIESITNVVEKLISKSEFFLTLFTCQVISNVPTAVMLSGFTKNSYDMLLATNIGGLGTLIASLASLISFKLYAKSENSDKLKFLGIFTVYNIVVAALLVVFVMIIN